MILDFYKAFSHLYSSGIPCASIRYLPQVFFLTMCRQCKCGQPVCQLRSRKQQRVPTVFPTVYCVLIPIKCLIYIKTRFYGLSNSRLLQDSKINHSSSLCEDTLQLKGLMFPLTNFMVFYGNLFFSCPKQHSAEHCGIFHSTTTVIGKHKHTFFTQHTANQSIITGVFVIML